MKKNLFPFTSLSRVSCAFALTATIVLTACDDDFNDENRQLVDAPFELFMLSEGSMGKNDATLSGLHNGKVTTNLYYQANNQRIGDTANDLVRYGNSLFMAVTGSKYVAKLDLQGREIARYTCSDAPRNLATFQGDLYVSTYGAQVLKLDTLQMQLTATCAVGDATHPQEEEMAIVGSNLYVLDCGYSAGNTISVVDLNKFTCTEQYTVRQNPNKVVADYSKLFVLSTEYGADWSATNYIQEVDPRNGNSQTIAEATHMAAYNNMLYLIQSETPDYVNYTNTFFSYDIAKHQLNKASFLASVPEGLQSTGVYGFSIDASNGNFLISTSDYVTESNLYIFNAQGELLLQTSTGGLNTKKFISGKK